MDPPKRLFFIKTQCKSKVFLVLEVSNIEVSERGLERSGSSFFKGCLSVLLWFLRCEEMCIFKQ